MLKRVTCLQNVSDIRSVVVQADLLMIPNAAMPMRSVVLESMRCKVPIICNAMQGYDMLIDEETALLHGDGWAKKIDRILNDPTCATQLGRNASELVLEKYRSTDQIAAFEALITLI